MGSLLRVVVDPRCEGGQPFAADFLESVEKSCRLRAGPVEAQKAKPVGLANREATFRDLTDHRFSRNDYEIPRTWAGDVDLGMQPDPIGVEPRPQHRLDQHERKGWR
jgi:hypothetical protein